MSAVCLDTVGLLALWDVRDQWHKPAQAVLASAKPSQMIAISQMRDLSRCFKPKLWAGHIAAGETARLGSNDPAQIGEGPMAWPTVAKITAALNALTAAEAEQLRAKEKADDEEEQATALDPEVDAFIKDMWDTIEFNLRTHEATSLRRRAREWGVFYATRPGEPEETETPANPPAPTPPPA